MVMEGRDTFEIKDEEIDVEEIMRKIRENIKNRKESGVSPEDVLDLHCRSIGFSDRKKDLFREDCDINQDLEQIKLNWDIENNSYYISSHHPIVGKVLTMGRELIHNEVQRYVDPTIEKQIEFNRSTARILSKLDTRIDQTKDIRIETENRIRTIIAAMNEDIENKAWLASILEKRIDIGRAKLDPSWKGQTGLEDYFIFEEQFRGSRADTKQKQSVFLHYFDQCKSVLDIGCGRGEFLEMLKERNINVHGVDVDQDMVEYCKSKGLDVEKIDAVSYLERIDANSLEGIFIDQVVEHLEPDYLVKMLCLCYRKLKNDHYMIVETVNPLSFVSFANFYSDMSHKKPIHPETMKFLFRISGFREIDAKFLSPISDDARLRRLELRWRSETEKKMIETYNYNIDMLNSILFGAQDYAVIGKK